MIIWSGKFEESSSEVLFNHCSNCKAWTGIQQLASGGTNSSNCSRKGFLVVAATGPYMHVGGELTSL